MMKVVGRECLNASRDLLYANCVSNGTVFRYEDGDTLFMKVNGGVADLETGDFFDESEDGINNANSIWTTPINIVVCELHVIEELTDNQ